MKRRYPSSGAWLVALGAVILISSIAWSASTSGSRTKSRSAAKPAPTTVAAPSAVAAPSTVATPSATPVKSPAKAAAPRPAAKPAPATRPSAPRVGAPVLPPAVPMVLTPVSAGMKAFLDPETGTFTSPYGPDLAPMDLRPRISPEDLVEVRLPDGSYMIDLQGLGQEYTIVDLDALGHRSFRCVHDPAQPLRTILVPAPAAPKPEER